MKKVLILAYDFPPLESVGAQRPYFWFRYFNKYGLFPIVITIQQERNTRENFISSRIPLCESADWEHSDQGEVYRLPLHPNLRDKFAVKFGKKYAIVRKILSLFFHVLQYITLKFDNKNKIYHFAEYYLKTHPVDYIIATGEPFVLFKYASSLSDKYKIPWYADYRDDWIEDHVKTNKNKIYDKMLSKIESLYEKKFVKNVSGFSTVSREIAEQISLRTEVNRYIVIENGADIDTINEMPELEGYPKLFKIVYTGVLYDLPYLDDFIAGFKLFINCCTADEKEKVKVVFVGIEMYQNMAVKAAHKLKAEYPNNVEIQGRVSSKEAIEIQKSASVLLNLIAGDPSKGLLGAKCYAYAATKIPIMSIPFIKTASLMFFPDRDIHFFALNPSQVETFLSARHNKFVCQLPYKSDITEDEIFNLSREYMTSKLAKYILEV